MTVTIACIDVGQGDCTVAVDEDTGDGILIDCRGGMHERAADELRHLGLAELRHAIVSHTQIDHFGGVLDTLEELADRFTGSLYFNQDSLMAAPTVAGQRKVAGQKLRALINRASEFGDRLRRAEDSAPSATVGNLSWKLLAPSYTDVVNAIAKGDPNLASGVVLLKVGSDSVVIGGDAQFGTWERIAAEIPKAAVIRWPHHGGAIDADPNAHARLRELLQPATVIVSVGAQNTYGHPTSSFFSALGGGGPCRLLCTQATSTCVSGGGPGRICAGTIRIHIGATAALVVTTETPNHAAVIARLGNGQCT